MLAVGQDVIVERACQLHPILCLDSLFPYLVMIGCVSRAPVRKHDAFEHLIVQVLDPGALPRFQLFKQ